MLAMSYPTKWRISMLAVGILLWLPYFLKAPMGLTTPAFIVLMLMCSMALLWLLELIPLAATSLLPLVYLPLTGVLPIGRLLPSYSNSVVFLFLGGFILGLAMEKQNLHKRIAFRIISFFGTNLKLLLLGTMVSCAFVSMWINNTTTSIMMVPLAFAIIKAIGVTVKEEDYKKLCTVFLLSVAYASSLGGVATIVGSTPNIFLKGFMESQYNINVSFLAWMVVGLPISITMLLVTWLWFARIIKDINVDSRQVIDNFKLSIGKMSKGEKLVAIVFAGTAFLWVFQGQVSSFLSYIFNTKIVFTDTTIAMLSSIILFTTPVSLKDKTFLIDWEKAKEVPWGVLLLFGGGLALSVAINETKLSVWFGNLIKTDGVSLLIIMGIATTVVLFLTEINSNTATSATFLPILAAVAVASAHIDNVLYLITPAAIAASCAFMMPISTPPNAIAYATGTITLKEMNAHGLALNIAAVFVITLASYYLIGVSISLLG